MEQISIRSLRLRHHRGMVHTIPFGDISSVTNFTRNYIVMKLSFRVWYNTDVDQVRKIVKRIYKDIIADEEFAPKLLGKIKSQGVSQMDDSAMIMRIKFKCVPGEQFILRREIYRRLQVAFREKGIQFAHKNVTVYLPSETLANADGSAASGSLKEKVPAAAGGGAMAVEQGEDGNG